MIEKDKIIETTCMVGFKDIVEKTFKDYNTPNEKITIRSNTAIPRKVVGPDYINPNGYIYDVVSLNNALDKYIEYKKICQKSTPYDHDVNRKIIDEELIMGKIQGYDDNYFYIEITNLELYKEIKNPVALLRLHVDTEEDSNIVKVIDIDCIDIVDKNYLDFRNKILDEERKETND